VCSHIINKDNHKRRSLLSDIFYDPYPCPQRYIFNLLSSPFVVAHSAWSHTHKQPFSTLEFVRDNPGKPVPEETFTHSRLSWLSVIPYLLPPSVMIHGILPVQFKCLTVFFHNLSPSLLWSTSWPGTLHFILHTFLHQIIVFLLQHMPIPLQLVLQ